VTVARAFRDRLGLTEIYIADLDAIAGQANPAHQDAIRRLAGEPGMRIILDSGIADISSAQESLDLGIEKVVIGAETLPDWASLQSFPVRIPPGRLIFSLDMRAGTIMSRSPVEALIALDQARWREVILLDLSRVGSSAGVDQELAAAAHAAAPELRLIAAGGVVGVEELVALDRLGIAGALAATALHRGAITAAHILAHHLQS
jgi:phosphoribosylformimino-5-aminoimidazole carboxamide ribotide isomerase